MSGTRGSCRDTACGASQVVVAISTQGFTNPIRTSQPLRASYRIGGVVLGRLAPYPALPVLVQFSRPAPVALQSGMHQTGNPCEPGTTVLEGRDGHIDMDRPI